MQLVLPGVDMVATLHPPDDLLPILSGWKGIAHHGVLGTSLDGVEHARGCAEVHVGHPHGDDVCVGVLVRTGWGSLMPKAVGRTVGGFGIAPSEGCFPEVVFDAMGVATVDDFVEIIGLFLHDSISFAPNILQCDRRFAAVDGKTGKCKFTFFFVRMQHFLNFCVKDGVFSFWTNIICDS